MTVQERFRNHLGQGRPVPQLLTLLAEGATLALGNGFEEENERHRLCLAAAAAPTQASLEWLREQGALPTPRAALSIITTLMNGQNNHRDMRVADWLLRHGNVAPLVDEEAKHQWLTQALCRSDIDALAWLMHPPAPLTALSDPPDNPLIHQVMRRKGTSSPLEMVPQVLYLLAQGVPPRVDKSQSDDRRGHTPLSLLLRLYEDFLKKEKENKPRFMRTPEIVQALWVPLVQAGDNPYRRAPDSFLSLKTRLMDTPLAGLMIAQERAQSLPPPPERNRRRLRS